ncbi:MAG: hypothetical protein KBT29_11220 [Prevotellaceae bacterium]|nr:hypothetical protein [Candidatus Minthosoma caballi]
MNKYRNKKFIKSIICVLVLVLAVLAVYVNRPWIERDIMRTQVKVEQRIGYVLLADGNEVAYFSRYNEEDSSFVGLSLHKDSALIVIESEGAWVNSSPLFPSANGLVLVADEAFGMRDIATKVTKDVNQLILLNNSKLKCDKDNAEAKCSEIDYYLVRHSVFDNEYVGVTNYSYNINAELNHLNSVINLLDSVIENSNEIVVKSISEYNVQIDSVTIIPFSTNEGCKLKPWLTSAYISSGHLSVIGSDSINSIPDSALAVSTPLFLKTDLSDYVVRSAWYVSELAKQHACPHDSSALKYIDLYRYIPEDSLFIGEWVDTLGNRYHGQMKENGEPNGIGVMKYDNGDYYEGQWKCGVRDGRGFYVTVNQMIKAGEWGNGKYKGERMTYTANRVYGIDISRYQHEIGKKKYTINWGALRIRSLGPRNNANVNGEIDFPVSFVFIKSTQGTNIVSAYYQQDAQDARKYGKLVGAYHFYSAKANAAEQARHFLKNTQILARDLPPVLDVEPSEKEIESNGGEEHMFDAIRTWMEIVESATGKRPILYVSQSFIMNHLVKAPDICLKYQVWIARYNTYRPEVKLLFWQLCPDGKVQGIQGDVDINIFNGYDSQFEEMFFK